MRTTGRAGEGPTVDMTGADERAKWRTRSHGRIRRWILIAVGVLLIAFGSLLLVIPVAGADEGHTCGDATAVATAFGQDSAADGDRGWCRSAGRIYLAGALLGLVLPGSLLMLGQVRAVCRAPLVDARPADGFPGAARSASRSPRDAPSRVAAPSAVVRGEDIDLYLNASRTRTLLLLSLFLFFMMPFVWVIARAGMLGLRRRPVLTLDDMGLTDHRYRVELPWALVRDITLAGSGTQRNIEVEVTDLTPLRPRARLGAVMRWAALRLSADGRRLRLNAAGIDGVEAFVSAAASHVTPTPDLLPDRLVVYRSPWWLAGLPVGAALAVYSLHRSLTPEGLTGDEPVLVLGALVLLIRGLTAVRARPLLMLDRSGVTYRRLHAFHASWDEVASVEYIPAGGESGGKWNQFRVRLQQPPGALHPPRPGGHGSPAERILKVDGLSRPAHEIAEVAEYLYAAHRDGTLTDSSQPITSRPNRLAATAAVAMAVIVAGAGWYIPTLG